MCDKLTKDLMCFECLCLSCNRLMLRDAKELELEQRNARRSREAEAEVLRYLWSKGTLGAKELRKRGAWNS